MVDRLTLFGWLVALEALDTPSARERALDRGTALLDLGREELGDEWPGDQAAARALAQLHSDSWIAWDWAAGPGDARKQTPEPQVFEPQDLRWVQDVRVTAEGYAAAAAPQLGMVSEPAASPDVEYDLFISHASEDKAEVARPLAEALQARGFSVWFDEEQIEVGDSLLESINIGLAHSRFGVVVFSESFFAKSWPRRELEGLVALEDSSGENRILPVWHQIDLDFMTAKAPLLAGRFALNTETGAQYMADRLSRRLTRSRSATVLASAARAPASPSAGPVVPAGPAPADEEHADPLQVRERTLSMLRADDRIGLSELVMYERRHFEQQVTIVLQEAGDASGSAAGPDVMKPVEEKLFALTDRRLASLLPLVQYAPERLRAEVQSLAEMVSSPVPTRSPYSAWLDGKRWPVWQLLLIVGTTATALGQFSVVGNLWEVRLDDDGTRPLAVMYLLGGAELGAKILLATKGKQMPPDELWYPAFRLWDSDLIRSHYPEIQRGGDTPDAPLGFLSRAGDFLWLCGGLAGREDVAMIRYWTRQQIHPTLRQRLAASPVLREQLAGAIDADPQTLLVDLDGWVSSARGPDL